MIEVKIVMPPEVHELLKVAQAATGIARQDVAIGAYLAGEFARVSKSKVEAGIAATMFRGLPRMMEVLRDEPLKSASDRAVKAVPKKRKPRPRPKRKVAPKGKPSRKAARK